MTLDRMTLVRCVAAGVVAALVTAWLLLDVIPLGGHVRKSLLPYEGAVAAGVLVALGLASRRAPRLRPLVQQLSLGVGVAVAMLVAVFVLDGTVASRSRPLLRTHFSSWIPLLAGCGAALWIAAFVAERSAKRRLPVFTALIFGVALACVSLQVGQYQYKAFAGERVRAWNVFHYYAGSKYFSELSYYDLYAATLSADDDFAELRRKRGKRVHDRFSKITKARDQRDYQNKPRAEITAGFDRSIISEERLRELGEDTRWIGQFMGFRSPGWKQCFKDLGYNPAPPWTVVGVPLSNAVPTDSKWFLIITNSDVPLYVVTLLLLGWAFGLRSASIMALWLCSAQLNEARFTGGFLQYDWMCTTLSAVALFHRGWHKSAGAVLSWAAMTRVFPGFLVFGLGLKLALDLVRRKEVDRGQWNFLLAFTLACAALFAASNMTGRGLDTWPEWVDKIERHSKWHAVTSNMRVGVGRMVIHVPRTGRFWGEAKGNKREKLEQGHDRKRAYQLLGLLLLIPALVRRRDLDAIILMLFLPFLLVVTSRYYASVWALLFLLGSVPRGSPGEGRTSWAAFVAGTALLLYNATFYAWDSLAAGRGVTTAYFVLNYVMYAVFCGLCVGYLVGDLRAWRQRRQQSREPSAQGGVVPGAQVRPPTDPEQSWTTNPVDAPEPS